MLHILDSAADGPSSQRQQHVPQCLPAPASFSQGLHHKISCRRGCLVPTSPSQIGGAPGWWRRRRQTGVHSINMLNCCRDWVPPCHAGGSGPAESLSAAVALWRSLRVSSLRPQAGICLRRREVWTPIRLQYQARLYSQLAEGSIRGSGEV